MFRNKDLQSIRLKFKYKPPIEHSESFKEKSNYLPQLKSFNDFKDINELL